jgi:NTE family protein
MIKHLVISGGGPLGFRYLGALEQLEIEKFWTADTIESIYATSVGSMIGAFICLKYDWETLNKYVIERPWHEAFKVSAKQIFDSYYKKGLFDKKFVEIIFKPLLEAKNLPLTITLKEFYEYSHIDLHIFTFELNKFKTCELSYKTHPDMLLTQAITMSSALPGIFIPIIMDGGCYIDGGVMHNYPLNPCLRDHPNADEILGVKLHYIETYNLEVTEESSLLEYIICITINTNSYMQQMDTIKDIENTVKCETLTSPLKLESIKDILVNAEMRRQWMADGKEDGRRFLQHRGKHYEQTDLKNGIQELFHG